MSRFSLCTLTTSGLLSLLCAAAGAQPADPSPFRDAFTTEDIDWDRTAEFPANPGIAKHPHLPYRDGILRAVGVIEPDGSNIMAHWGGGWRPAGGAGYCRLAFRAPVAIGTIIRGSDWYGNVPGPEVSILGPEAVYPGDVNDDADWQAVQPVEPCAGATIYVLPPETKTRAVRIEGGVKAMRFLVGRFSSLTPSASAAAGAGDGVRLLKNGAWHVSADAEISPELPQWVILSWETMQQVRALLLTRPVFERFEVAYFAGSTDADPSTAPEEQWKLLGALTVAKPWRAPNQKYMDFGRTITTAALRVRVTGGFDQVEGGGGPRVISLRGLVVLADLGTAAAPKPVAEKPAAEIHPPIPVRFTLKEPGYVTLVIDDANGRRVRNLVAETDFPAGENIVWWDGLDESSHTNMRDHGVYELLGRTVQSGRYRVRGLCRNQIDLRYEMAVYTAGDPPWPTADGSGWWLADHTPSSAALFLPGDNPQVLISSFVAEAGHGFAWLDLTGRKLRGIRSTGGGGGWWGAAHLARDAGERALPGVSSYNASAWQDYLEIWSLERTRKLHVHKFENKELTSVGGLAVHNGLVAASLTRADQVLFVDAATGEALGTAPLHDPRGLAFAASGRMLALSGKRLLRFPSPAAEEGVKLPEPEVIISNGLEDPKQLAFDAEGNVYVSDWGSSHQVKVFTSAGRLLRAIGKPGAPGVGPYDEMKMHSPHGITVSDDGHLWVAENHYVPKRVSVWTLDGKLVNAMYGPNWYGGGGNLDPKDKTRFYVHGNGGGMEFKLDWDQATSKLVNIYYLPGQTGVALPEGFPQFPLYVNGRQYMLNLYSQGPTNGEAIASIWQMLGGLAVPVAALGQANNWELLKGDAFRPRWPEGIDLSGGYWQNQALFAWSDLNDDGQVQPEEVAFARGAAGGLTVNPDLSVVTATALRFTPREFTTRGAPIYDVTKGEKLVEGARQAGSSGGNQTVDGRNGWAVMTWPPAPLTTGCMAGAHNGTLRWTYPCETLGLHASHSAPLPKHPGYLIGVTRLLGMTVTPRGTNEELWAINGNKGVIYLMTTDGLFVATLFKDIRQASTWPRKAARDALLNDVTLRDECFFPSINQAADGNVYLVVGQPFSAIVRVDGLGTIRRLPDAEFELTADLHEAAIAYQLRVEAQRAAKEGGKTLIVGIREAAPTVDGDVSEWPASRWVQVEPGRGSVSAAVAVSGDRLYAAFQTTDANLLNNTGEAWQMLFRSGGALDLMVGTDPQADPERDKAVAGDLRLIVTRVAGRTVAVLYRPVVPGTREPVPFASPWRAIHIDRVDDVSDEVELAHVGGSYELSVPLAALGLKPTAGMVIRGDVGVLRGRGGMTVQRLYWHNKASGVVSDVPSEAMLTPHLWGRWRFLAQ